jgi:GNAT superfamily N-acetyltransferase
MMKSFKVGDVETGVKSAEEPEFELEACRIQDAVLLHEMYQSSFETVRVRYPETIPYENYHSIRDVERALSNSGFTYFKVNVGGKSIGAIHLGLVEFGQICRIRMFFMLPEYQNRGIGSAVLKRAEHALEPVKGWELCVLRDESRNRHFYEKSGYAVQNVIFTLRPGVHIVKYGKYRNGKNPEASLMALPP